MTIIKQLKPSYPILPIRKIDFRKIFVHTLYSNIRQFYFVKIILRISFTYKFKTVKEKDQSFD